MLKHRTVLITEDDPELRESLQTVLERDHYKVLTACNGLEALTILEGDHEIDLVVSDISMPKLSGLQLLEKVQLLTKPAPPVILLTGHGEGEKILEALRLGAFDYIQKPLMAKEFLTVVARAVELGIQIAAVENELQAEKTPSKETIAKARRKIQLLRQAQRADHTRKSRTG